MPGGDSAQAAVWFARVALLCLMTVACAYDARQRRVPNWVAVATLALGLCWHGIMPAGSGLFVSAGAGSLGLSASAAGAVAAFVSFMLLHLIRAMGAGDVKLMGALGAWFGLQSVPLLVLYVLVAGGLLAVARLLLGVPIREVISNLKSMIVPRRDGRAGRLRFGLRHGSADRMPYAWALALGAFGLAFRQYTG